MKVAKFGTPANWMPSGAPTTRRRRYSAGQIKLSGYEPISQYSRVPNKRVQCTHGYLFVSKNWPKLTIFSGKIEFSRIFSAIWFFFCQLLFLKILQTVGFETLESRDRQNNPQFRG